MPRTIKHFSLDRIDGTELRVAADTDGGVLRLIEVEEEVIRAYIRHGTWAHEWVTLFILQDFAPLVGQLEQAGDLPPGGQEAIEQRPVVNIYDLADLSGCRVFMNRRQMEAADYWDDLQAVRALLAHEHAHPLAECPTTRASRRLKLELSEGNLRSFLGDRTDEIMRVLSSVARKLCLDSPREVLANDLAIQSGFGDALLHLDKRNVANAAAGMIWRKQVERALQAEVAETRLTPAAANLLMIVGDVQGYLELAIETAPFYRAGRAEGGHELEFVLQEEVLPKLRPGVGAAYIALRERYEALETEMSASALVEWGDGVCGAIGGLLTSEGAQIEHRLSE